MAVVLDNSVGVAVVQPPAPAIVVRPKSRLARQPGRSRLPLILGIVAALLVLLLIGLSQWGFVADRVTSYRAAWPASSSEPIARYSNAQGAQDAPRAEMMEGRRSDREKCLDTLRLRRVDLQTARDTCAKMIEGIYHG